MLHRRGAWIFVSHSLRDFRRVRRVRDALEELGHFPLLFYLRSLADDAEVDGLIRREIEARNFFLLCDSDNARSSRWVQGEIKLIKSRPQKLFARVDLDSNWDDQLRVINDVSARMSVFISASSIDRTDSADLAAALEQADYSMLGRSIDLIPGEGIQEQIRKDIDEAMRDGIVLVLLSPESVRREQSFQWFEVHYALTRALDFPPGRPRVLPVVLRDLEETMNCVPPGLNTIQALDLSRIPSAEKPAAVLAELARITSIVDA